MTNRLKENFGKVCHFVGVKFMKNSIWQNQTMDVLKKSLTASSLRHKSISENIANVNTPNYKRQIVRFEEELSKSLATTSRLPLSKTNSLHIPTEKYNPLAIQPEIELGKT